MKREMRNDNKKRHELCNKTNKGEVLCKSFHVDINKSEKYHFLSIDVKYFLPPVATHGYKPIRLIEDKYYVKVFVWISINLKIIISCSYCVLM